MRNTKKIVLGVVLFLSLGASSVSADYQLWAEGVNKDIGWTDVTQNGPTCGSTTATNMIYWWLGQAKKDYNLSEGINKSIQDLWREVTWSGYRQEYVDVTLRSYSSQYGLNLNATLAESPYYVSYPGTGGNNEETYRAISAFLKSAFEKKGICGITNSNEAPHAVTCYGAKFNDEWLVTELYIADSAWNQYKLNEMLEVYTFDSNDFCFRSLVKDPETGASIGSVFEIDYIDALWYDKSLVTGLTPLIPEPSAFGFLAGIGALALIASRRRRKYFTPEAVLLGEKK